MCMHTRSHKKKQLDIEEKCCNISVSVLVVKVCKKELKQQLRLVLL